MERQGRAEGVTIMFDMRNLLGWLGTRLAQNTIQLY